MNNCRYNLNSPQGRYSDTYSSCFFRCVNYSVLRNGLCFLVHLMSVNMYVFTYNSIRQEQAQGCVVADLNNMFLTTIQICLGSDLHRFCFIDSSKPRLTSMVKTYGSRFPPSTNIFTITFPLPHKKHLFQGTRSTPSLPATTTATPHPPILLGHFTGKPSGPKPNM